jgi:hypothetical protein
MSRHLFALAGLLGAAALACTGLGGSSPPPRIEIPVLAGPAAMPSHAAGPAGLGPERYRRDPRRRRPDAGPRRAGRSRRAADVVEGVTPALANIRRTRRW